ncbi:MAG: thiol reductant ABC exporter subunit CydD [Desulfobulbaceae bacterium]|nr:thiol reductant ABC exporter subunit CydD [Desulfobulbaceae bacterium]
MNISPRLFQLLKIAKVPFILSVILGLLSTLFVVGQAVFLSKIINLVRIFSLDEIPLLLIGFAVMSVLRMLLSWLSRNEANRGTLRIKDDVFNRLIETIGKLGPTYSRSVQSGQLSTTVIKGVEALDAYFSQYLPQLILGVMSPLLIVAVVFWADWLSGIILLVTAPLIPVFMILIGKTAAKATDKQWDTLSKMGGYFLDVLQGLTTLKLFAQSKTRRKGIEEASEAFRSSTMEVLKTAFLSSLTLELVGTIGTALIAVSIGLRLMKGGMEFQPALFVLILTPEFYLPLRQLGLKFHAGMEGMSASKDIFAIIDRSEASPIQGKTALPEKILEQNPICFEQVTFSYPNSSSPALDKISCTFPAGKTTAIVGPSGAGKSTLISLLLRFHKPNAGKVYIDGLSIHEVQLEEWHRQISWVPQHPYLFNTTLNENLLLSKPTASEAELCDTLEKAGLKEFVRELPNGIETVVGEMGARLSGGEAQRVALARAFLKDAPLLILDEPSSQTDPELEASLRYSIDLLKKNRTTIIIAHRLETIRSADQILVIENGKITRSGTHDELAAEDGFYRDALLLRERPELRV